MNYPQHVDKQFLPHSVNEGNLTVENRTVFTRINFFVRVRMRVEQI